MTRRNQSFYWLATLLLGLLWLLPDPVDPALAGPVRDLVAEWENPADDDFLCQRLIPPDAEAILQAWGVPPGAIAPRGHVLLPKGLTPTEDPAPAYRITRSPPVPLTDFLREQPCCWIGFVHKVSTPSLAILLAGGGIRAFDPRCFPAGRPTTPMPRAPMASPPIGLEASVLRASLGGAQGPRA